MNAQFNLNGVILKTDRLVLRPFTKDDLNDFNEYTKVEGVGEMAGWEHHKTIEITKEVIARFIEEDKTFAILHKKSH